MQESKSRSSDARSVKDNEEEDTAEQRREDGDGCRDGTMEGGAYLIFVTDATDGVRINFFGRCKFLQI